MKDARLKAHFHTSFVSGNHHGRMPVCVLATLFSKSNRACSRLDSSCDIFPLRASALVLAAARLSPLLTCHVSTSADASVNLMSGAERARDTRSSGLSGRKVQPTACTSPDQPASSTHSSFGVTTAWIQRKDPFPGALVKDFLSTFDVPTDPPSGHVSVVVIPAPPSSGDPFLVQNHTLTTPTRGSFRDQDADVAHDRAGEAQAFEMRVEFGERAGGGSVLDCLARQAVGISGGAQGLMTTR